MRLDDVYRNHLNYISYGSVNCGHCYIWAWIVAAHVPSATLWSDTKAHKDDALHAFVRIGNIFFDSETTRGVQNPLHLPCFKRCNVFSTQPFEIVEKLTPREFFCSWNVYPSDQDGYFASKLRRLLSENQNDPVFVKTMQDYTARQVPRWAK